MKACCNPELLPEELEEDEDNNIEDNIEDDTASFASRVLLYLSDAEEEMDYSDGTSG